MLPATGVSGLAPSAPGGPGGIRQAAADRATDAMSYDLSPTGQAQLADASPTVLAAVDAHPALALRPS